MGLSPQFGRREFLPVAQSLPPRGLPTAVSSQAQPWWVGQLSDERLQAPEWPSVAWKAHGGSAAGAHSLQSLVSGEILGGEPHIAARLSQTRRWRPGEPEGPVRGGKHRAEVEPCGPGPRGWTQECASIQGCSGAGGGRGGPSGTPLGLVLVPAGSAGLRGPGASRGQNCLWTEDLPPERPLRGAGALRAAGPCGIPGLRGRA